MAISCQCPRITLMALGIHVQIIQLQAQMKARKGIAEQNILKIQMPHFLMYSVMTNGLAMAHWLNSTPHMKQIISNQS